MLYLDLDPFTQLKCSWIRNRFRIENNSWILIRKKRMGIHNTAYRCKF